MRGYFDALFIECPGTDYVNKIFVECSPNQEIHPTILRDISQLGTLLVWVFYIDRGRVPVLDE